MAINNTEAGRRLWQILRSNGFTEAGAAGILGNIYSESAFVSNNLQQTFEKKLGYTDESYTSAVDSGLYPNFVYDGAGYGLCQWTYWSRKQALYNFAVERKVSIGDESMQVDFFLKELAGYPTLIKLLKETADVREASDGVMLQYERPADQSETSRERRYNTSAEIYELFRDRPADKKEDVTSVGKIITSAFKMPSIINGIKVGISKLCNPRNYRKMGSSRFVKYVVIHYTGNTKDTAIGNANYFCNNGGVGASAHFFVDEASYEASVNPVYHCAWHCGAKVYKHKDCRNDNSIGIEMCCSGNAIVSEKTKHNAAHLAAWWCKELGIKAVDVDTYVLRHYDVTGKLCPAQMATANNAEWAAFKKMIKDILTTGSIDMNTGAVTTSTADIPKPSYPKLPFTVKVTATKLNVRSGPGTIYNVSGNQAAKGDVLTIIDTSDTGWGKLKSGCGWISLSYVEIGSTVKDVDVTPAVSVRSGERRVKVTTSKLNVRVGPGSGYGLSKNSPVSKDEVFTIVETQGNWGKLKSGAGWICLDYTADV